MNVPGTTKLNAGACGSETSAENCSFRYAIGLMPLVVAPPSRTLREAVWRARAASAGADASALVEYVAATVVSGGMLAFVGNAAFADAPLGSDGSRTGTLVSPGAALGIATASLAEKLCGADTGAEVSAGGTGEFGAVELEPPPPPQAARTATPRTAPPMSAEIRFMHAS